MESSVQPLRDPVPPPPAPPVDSGSAVPGTALVASDLAAMEARLQGLVDGAPVPVPAIADHLVGGGGKRIRPLILLLSARAHGLRPRDVVPLACASELLHSATLLHDDVVDEADQRRGRVVAHRLWGNGMAVLAGDFCLARALTESTEVGRLEAVTSLSATVRALAEGEVIQLFHQGQLDLREETYFAVLERKTASLIAWCARVGGLLPEAADRTMARYGRAMGVAFQIADDVLDYQGDAAVTGKSIGTDLREGKTTLPLIEACRRIPGLSAELERLQDQGWTEATVASLMHRIRECGAVEAARDRALQAATEARTALRPLPPSPERDALADLAAFCADRVR